MTFTVELSEEAEDDLKAIKDRRTRQSVERGLLKLEAEPEKRGRALAQDLLGYYRIRVAGQRYRAIYRIDQEQARVRVVVIGIRKEGDKRDVYRVARRRLRKP